MDLAPLLSRHSHCISRTMVHHHVAGTCGPSERQRHETRLARVVIDGDIPLSAPLRLHLLPDRKERLEHPL
jgi:hypothetical protein